MKLIRSSRFVDSFNFHYEELPPLIRRDYWVLGIGKGYWLEHDTRRQLDFLCYWDIKRRRS